MESFVAHQTFNKGDGFPVGRPTRNCYLQRGLIDGGRIAVGDDDGVNLRDPPIVVAWSRRGGGDKCFIIGRPIVVVDVQVGG